MRQDETGEGGTHMDEEPGTEELPPAKADLASKIYIATGVPGIILFMVILFSFTRSCGIPA